MQNYLAKNHATNKRKVGYYLNFMDSITGWFSKEAAQLFLWINSIQQTNNVNGNIGEIGTYQGKSAILLALMTNPTIEKLIICDPFDTVPQNNGLIKQLFQQNLDAFFYDKKFIEVYSKKSQELTSKECHDVRFFHIDGGHTAEETYLDLCLASDCLIETGIVAIDDLFNEFWPGVMEGVYKFLTTQKALVPIIIGFNKFLLCKKSKHDWYLDKLANKDWQNYITKKGVVLIETNLFNHKALIIGEPR